MGAAVNQIIKYILSSYEAIYDYDQDTALQQELLAHDLFFHLYENLKDEDRLRCVIHFKCLRRIAERNVG